MRIQKYPEAYKSLCEDTTVSTHRGIDYLLHPKISMHILHTVFYTFPSGADKEILLNNQELLCLLIIFIILMTSMFDSVVIL